MVQLGIVQVLDLDHDLERELDSGALDNLDCPKCGAWTGGDPCEKCKGTASVGPVSTHIVIYYMKYAPRQEVLFPSFDKAQEFAVIRPQARWVTSQRRPWRSRMPPLAGTVEPQTRQMAFWLLVIV